MARIGTIAGGVGVVTTLQITYLPQFLSFTVALTPTAMTIRVLGEGTNVDLDANGLDNFNGFLQLGRNADGYLYALANGLIKGKNVEITVTNNGVPAFDLFGSSQREGDVYITMQRQTILANSGVDFTDFLALAVEAAGATDQFVLTYEDGTTENALREEVQLLLQYTQNLVGEFLIDNSNGILVKVNVLPAAQRIAYYAKYQPVGNVIDNAPVTSTESAADLMDAG